MLGQSRRGPFPTFPHDVGVEGIAYFDIDAIEDGTRADFSMPLVAKPSCAFESIFLVLDRGNTCQ